MYKTAFAATAAHGNSFVSVVSCLLSMPSPLPCVLSLISCTTNIAWEITRCQPRRMRASARERTEREWRQRSFSDLQVASTRFSHSECRTSEIMPSFKPAFRFASLLCCLFFLCHALAYKQKEEEVDYARTLVDITSCVVSLPKDASTPVRKAGEMIVEVCAHAAIVFALFLLFLAAFVFSPSSFSRPSEGSGRAEFHSMVNPK